MRPFVLRSARDRFAFALRRNMQAVGDGFARDLPLGLVVLAYAALVGSLAAGNATEIVGEALGTLVDFALQALISVFVLHAGLSFFVVKPKSPIRALAGSAFAAVPSGRFGQSLPFLAMLALLTAAFSVFKPSIPVHAGGFTWDAAILETSRALHFGFLPWEILQPVFGRPWITRILDLNYALWFPAMWLFVVGMAASRGNEAHRQRALLSFALLWIVAGTAIAAGFSSAGPCYYGRVVAGPDPYAGLMSYLDQVHGSIGLIAVDVQRLLWADYLGPHAQFGISAMPSLHNAVAALMVLACWRVNRWLRLATLVHAVLVFLGAILLGWHYALDIYVAWGVTAVIWMLVKPFAEWWAARLERPVAAPSRLRYA